MIIVLLCCTLICSAQSCGTIVRPESLVQLEQTEHIIQDWIATKPIQSRTVVTIPVVVHIVWKEDIENISDAQIYSQIDVINRDFRRKNSDLQIVPPEFQDRIADVEIEFCLASTAPDGSSTTGITRTQTTKSAIGKTNDTYFTDMGGKNAWDTTRYLNIWVADAGDLAGKATFPFDDLSYDGVVINYTNFGTIGTARLPFHLGRTLTHEIGHYLFLFHPFGSENGTCGEDDQVEDTPYQQGAYFDCPAYPSASCGSTDLTQNYMQYVDDCCMAMFTSGQKERMLATLHTVRATLLGSVACQEPNLPEADILIFPNPANSIFSIFYKTTTENSLIIRLYDNSGRIFHESEQLSNQYLPICVNNIPKGLYFVHLIDKTNNTKTIEKIVIN